MELNWTLRETDNRGGYGVCYGNGLFVVAAGGLSALVSPDGILWTHVRVSLPNSAPTTNYGFNSICYGDGLFVAVGSSTGSEVGFCVTSPDGINWTQRECPVGRWSDVCYGNGMFVATALNTASSLNTMYSHNGIDWTAGQTGITMWGCICFGNGIFVAKTRTGQVARSMASTDGINWTPGSSSGSAIWDSVCYGNGMFIAVRVGGEVAISTDGLYWARSNLLPMGSTISYGEGLFVAAGQLMIGTSINGINWKLIGESTAATVNDRYRSSCYGNGIFVVVGGNSVRTTNWPLPPHPLPPQGPISTGMAAGTTLTIQGTSWKLLDAFGGFPAISVEDFQLLPLSQILKRKEEFMYHLGGLHGAWIIESNDFIIRSTECDQEDIFYVFTASEQFVIFEANGNTVDVAIISTANSDTIPYKFVWDGGETADNGIQITQMAAGLRITTSDTTLTINGVITLTQERHIGDDAVLKIYISKAGAILYAGARAEASPPTEEYEIWELATEEPVYFSSPLVKQNPVKGEVFEFSVPPETMTMCIIIPATIGAPQKVMSLEPEYEMTGLFSLSDAKLTTGDVLCNVYYCTGLVPFAGSKKLQVTL